MECDHVRGFDMEYNKLTRKLLAAGYTADDYPNYVTIDNYARNKNNLLDNYIGGFSYVRWWIYEKTFKTPCGMQCKGLTASIHLDMNGISWNYENDNPLITCPYHRLDCQKKHSLLFGSGNDITRSWCNVHLVDEEYVYEGSVEAVEKLEDDRIRREKVSFELARRGRTCDAHMHYDRDENEWKMNYDPINCGQLQCRGRHYGDDNKNICPILGRPLDKKKGNVFYDIKKTAERTDLKGTLFEGQIDTVIEKGIRYFSHPVSMDICKNVVKLCQDEIRWKVNMENHSDIFMALHEARLYKVEVINIRAEQRESRDLLQDLQDIKDGIHVYHASDMQLAAKRAKEERRKKSAEKATQQLRNKILKTGFASLDRTEERKARKMLTETEIDVLETKYQEEQKNKPVQMTLDDFM